jgi:hypothetical protein
MSHSAPKVVLTRALPPAAEAIRKALGGKTLIELVDDAHGELAVHVANSHGKDLVSAA